MSADSENPALQEKATAHLQSLIQKAGEPGGMARLKYDERRFLFTALLAAIVPADNKVRTIELNKLQQILETRYQLKGDVATSTIALARSMSLSTAEIEKLASQMSELLNIDDCCILIGQMWEIALSDHQLHKLEEDTILRLADAAGVPRKRTLEEQARAAGRH